MTEDKLNPDEIRADMEAGTLGEWRAGASVFYPGLDGPLTARVYTESPPNEIEVTGDKCGTNARRIARLPDLERGYLDATDENAALRAENERLREALTPSEDTKAAYISEVECDCPTETWRHYVPWTSIKAIMAMIRARAALNTEGEG